MPIPGSQVLRHRGPIFSSDFTHRRRGTRRNDRQDVRYSYDRRRQSSFSRDRQELREVTYSRSVDDANDIDVSSINNERGQNSNDDNDDEVLLSEEEGLLSVQQKFTWRLTNYTECTKPCGGGTISKWKFL